MRRIGIAGLVVASLAAGAPDALAKDPDDGGYRSWAELEAAAQSGDPAAEWRLAAERRDVSAIEALASQGHCHAIHSLAETSVEVAPSRLFQADASGCADGAVARSIMERALGPLALTPQALSNLTEQALRGDPSAEQAACTLATRRDHPDWSLLRFCRAAAERGDAQAEFLLGRMLHNRIDDRRTLPYTWVMVAPKLALGAKAALPHYRRAAERGHAAAQARLARLLATGVGVWKDDGEAARWAEMAAAQGDPEGMAVWGLLLLQGRGVTLDPARAVTLVERAARAGEPMAQMTLATLLLRGRHVPRDLPNGAAWAMVPDLSPHFPPFPLEESEPLMLEPPLRTQFVVQLVLGPATYVDARIRAALLRKELAESGEWPLIDPIPPAFHPGDGADGGDAGR